MSYTVSGSPETIWLVYGDLEHDDKHGNFPDVTWCEDAQFDSDVEYVRVDLARQEIDRLRGALIAWCRADWYEDDPDVSAPAAVLNARRLTSEALEQKP